MLNNTRFHCPLPIQPAQVVRAREAAERAAELAAMEAEAELAAMPTELSTVAEALKRSPLSLTVGGDHPGLNAIANRVRKLPTPAWIPARPGLQPVSCNAPGAALPLVPAARRAMLHLVLDHAPRPLLHRLPG